MKKDSFIVTIAISLLGSFIFYLTEKYLLIKIDFIASLSIPIWLIFTIVMIAIIITTLHFERKISDLKREISDIELKYNDIILNLKKENNEQDEGERYLGMALTTDLNNSLRNKLFEESLNRHNIYAGAYLGSVYLHGIDGKIQKDHKKAFNIFESVKIYDKTGLIYWFLGWMIEKGYVKKESDKPNLKLAYEYYEQSKQLGFIKAYNSIGKFNNFGNGIEVDTAKATENYHQGAVMGDINAMLNLAFLLEKDKDKIKEAERWFLSALENGSAFAGLRLGKLYMDNLSFFNTSHQEIADLYIKSINSGDLTEDKAACGYFWLSKLLAIDSIIDITALTSDKIKDWYQYCTLKAYTILFNLNEQGKHMGYVPRKIWDRLSESIKINL